jgi:hypothetical protein
MFFRRHKRATKIVTFAVSFIFVLQLVLPGLLFPLEAKAQYTDPARVADSISQKATDAAQKIKDGILDRVFKGIMLSVSQILKNTLIDLSKKAAEQMVTAMTTGDWGEGATFYEDAFGEMLENMKDQAVGEFLDGFNEMFGVNICEPALPEIELQMKLKLEIGYKTKTAEYEDVNKPNCTLSKLTSNWEAFAEEIESKYESVMAEAGEFGKNPAAYSLAMLQETADVSFNEGSEYYALLEGEAKLSDAQSRKAEAEALQRQEGEGTKPVSGVTGAKVETPAQTQKAHGEQELEEAKATTKESTKGAGDVITDIPESVAIAFLNTFVSQLWQQMVVEKYFVKGLADPASDSVPGKDGQHTNQRKEAVERELSSVKINYNVAQQQIDLLTEYSTCPPDKQMNNCVMDTGFAQAVRQGNQGNPMTVRQAMDEGFLKSGASFVGSSDDRNFSPDCYENNYCYSNLVKLRKARILPIGWEIVAKSISEGAVVTLGEVVDNFYNCGQNGAYDSEWCHLIDPNWVLVAPSHQCKALTAGPILLSAGTNARAEYCADLQSCIKEGEDGQCQSWGYCAAERNVFRFGGQQCEGTFNSCRSLNDSAGQSVSYLMHTVDSSDCDSSSVGCKWYSVWKDAAQDYKWSDSEDERVYLNNNILDKECDPNSDGCTRFVRTKPGVGTNLVPNGSFELFEGDPGTVLGGPSATEVFGWGDYQLTSSDDAYLDTTAIIIPIGDDLTSPLINVAPKDYTRYFSFSMAVQKIDQAANISANSIELMFNGALSDGISELYVEDGTIGLTVGDWGEISKIYQVDVTNANQVISNLQVYVYSPGGSVAIDAMALEEIDIPDLNSRHVYNEYASQNATYLKKASEYLNCYDTGSADTYGRPVDEAEIIANDVNNAQSTDILKGCDQYATLCSAEDVGCEEFVPTAGGSPVTGTISYADYCPQECADYNTFSQTVTFFEMEEYPVFMIPSTGQECSSAEVGCEEFTNLDLLGEGGEGKEYYTEPKLCAKLPEDQSVCQNYYTWEGDEVTGYQLEAHTLKRESGGNGPALIYGDFAGDCSADIYEAKSNPDCRQMFDRAGNAFYKLKSKTITCSEDCHPFRRTLQFDNAAQCEERLGEWRNGECIFMIIPGEGKQCSEPNSGCREYRGDTSGVSTILVDYNFTDYDNQLLAPGATPKTSPEFGHYLQTNGELFTNPAEVILSGGDLQVSFWLKSNSGISTMDFELRDENEALIEALVTDVDISTDWQFYTYKIPYEKTDVNVSVGFDANESISVDNFKVQKTNDVHYVIKDSWVTPTSCNHILNTDIADSSYASPQEHMGCREYLDREGTTHYLKSFSSLCAYDKVGCEAIIDTQNNKYPFEKNYNDTPSFDCTGGPMPSGVGGGGFVPGLGFTFSAQNLGAMNCQQMQSFIETECGLKGYQWDGAENKCQLPSIYNVPEDNLMYLVINDEMSCSSQAKGCTMIGQPTLTVDTDGDYVVKEENSEQVWANISYILDPETFETQGESVLCSAFNDMCEEYSDDKGAKYYFKQPGDKVCEYRKGIVGNQERYRWYKVKLDPAADVDDEECDSKEYYNDNNSTPYKNTEIDYDGWVGVCPTGSDKCTAFVDPTDFSYSEAGKPYYYINNEAINKSSCDSVYRKEGCVLFNDTSESENLYNAFETYINSNANSSSVDAVVEDTDFTGIYPAADCSSGWDYCGLMADCLAQENTVEDCIAVVLDTDAQPATPATELYCSNEQGNDATLALKNAKCTADSIMNKNTNITIKVVQDRECAAWLDCKSSSWSWDENQGKYIEVCDKVGLCDSFSPEEDSAKCVSFLNFDDGKNILTDNEVLKINYKKAERNVGWFGLDYSGYSIPDIAPIQYYNAYDIYQADPVTTCGGGAPASRGGNATPCVDDSGCNTELSDTDRKCLKVIDYRLVNQSNVSCSTDEECAQKDFCNGTIDGECICLNETCVRPYIKNTTLAGKYSPDPACRAYPSEDSPFPALAAESNVYANANIMMVPELDMSTRGNDDYACNYIEISYGGGAIKKYIPREPDYSPGYAPGYCQSDPTTSCDCTCADDGSTCLKDKIMCSDDSCSEGDSPGICLRFDADFREYKGWDGYCLEWDESITVNGDPSAHPCVTWYPSHTLSGLQDLNNQYDGAGFTPSAYSFVSGGPYFCVNSTRFEERKAYAIEVDGHLDCDGNEEQVPVFIFQDYLNDRFPASDPGDSDNTPAPVFTDDEGDLSGWANDLNDNDLTEIIVWGGLNNPVYANDLKKNQTECGDGGWTWENGLCRMSKDQAYEKLNQNYARLDNGGGDHENGLIILNDADPVQFWQEQINHCNNSRNKHHKLRNPASYCPDGYAAKNLFELNNSTHYSCCDYEDHYYIKFECVPTPTTTMTDVQGWFKDSGGQITGMGGLGSELEATLCTEFYKVASSTGENRAFTNTIHQGGNISTGSKCGALPKATPCGNEEGFYGAMNLAVDPTSGSGANPNGGWPYNLFVDENPEPTCTSPLSGLTEDHSGGRDCFNIDILDDLFARSYDYWKLEVGVDNQNPGKCESIFAGVAGADCFEDVDCKDLAIEQSCSPFPLGKCNNPPNENDDKFYDEEGEFDQVAWDAEVAKYTDGASGKYYCYSDFDCKGDKFYMGAGGDCPDGDTTCMLYCSQGPDASPTVTYTFVNSIMLINGQNYQNCPAGGYWENVASNAGYWDSEGGWDTAMNMKQCSKNYISAKANSTGATCSYDKANSNNSDKIDGNSNPVYKDSKAICFRPGIHYPTNEKKTYYDGTPNPNSSWNKIVSESWGDSSAPIVAGVNPTNKVDFLGNPIFEAVPYKLSVGTATGTQTEGEIVGEGGQLEVFVKFYAWANDNHMPLRTIRLNWGDYGGTVAKGAGINKAKFQNHKPQCQANPGQALKHCYIDVDGEEINSGLTCDSVADCKFPGTPECKFAQDYFGDTSMPGSQKANACLPGYFQFNNVYTCPSLIGIEECGSDATKSPCKKDIGDGRIACRFRVGVQVTDNWEYCNVDHYSNLVTVAGPNSYSELADECSNSQNAYEYFDGYIYVLP